VIIVKITGGLGNQLFQYAIGKALSLKLGCELVLDISFYPQQKLRKYELEQFQIEARLATKSEINKAGGGHNIVARLIRRVGLTSLLYPKYIKEIESTVYLSAIDNCNVGSYLDGYWQNPSYFDEYKEQLGIELTPIRDLSKQAQVWLERIEADNSVSLHVRRGDYALNEHTNSVHGLCSVEYYQNAVEYMHTKLDNPTFYIFSDDIQWCKNNLDSIDNLNFVDDTKTAIDDLILMKNCKANIIANSTFSWWGAYLGGSNFVAAPISWFSESSRNNQQLLPCKWRAF
jgi:hypothetical protein